MGLDFAVEQVPTNARMYAREHGGRIVGAKR